MMRVLSAARRARVDLLVALALALAAALLASAAYRTGRATTLAVDAEAVMLPLKGVYDVEQYADQAGSFRWTSGEAQVRLPNPGGPSVATLMLAGGARGAVPLRVDVGSYSASFEVRPEQRRYQVYLPAQPGESLKLRLTAPAEEIRSRELGVVLGGAGADGGGAAPRDVALALAFAALGGYALMRRGGLGRWWAAGAALALEAALALWQGQAGGWRFMIFGQGMLAVGAAGLAGAALDALLPRPTVRGQPAAPLARADWLLIGGLLALALCVRIPLLFAPDPVGDLELSGRRMAALHDLGFAGAFTGGGDYMPVRLYWLRAFAEIAAAGGAGFLDPLPPLTMVLIKLPGLLADLAVIGMIYAWARRSYGRLASVGFAALYAFAPPVWINVAWWGQVDAILILPLIAMLLVLDRADGVWAWLCWALALLIKPQAIIFAPVLYAATARQYGARGLLRGGAAGAGLLVAGCAPLALIGQGAGMLQAYAGSVGRFPYVTNRAYNLWYLLLEPDGGPDTVMLFGLLSYRTIGMLLIGAVAALACAALLARADTAMRLEAGALIALGFFLLPTQIHERYLFLALALLVLSAVRAPRLLLPLAIYALISATLNILGTLSGFWEDANTAIASSPLPKLLSATNLVALGILLAHMLTLGWRAWRRGPVQPQEGTHATT